MSQWPLRPVSLRLCWILGRSLLPVSMASAAGVAATPSQKAWLCFLSRLNGLCGRCRCDSLIASNTLPESKSQWPLRPVSLRPDQKNRWPVDTCLNGLCGRCRCDAAVNQQMTTQGEGLNGLCGRCRCDGGCEEEEEEQEEEESQWPPQPTLRDPPHHHKRTARRRPHGLIHQTANQISKTTRAFTMRESCRHVLRVVRESNFVDRYKHTGLLAGQHQAADETKSAPCETCRGICGAHKRIR